MFERHPITTSLVGVCGESFSVALMPPPAKTTSTVGNGLSTGWNCWVRCSVFAVDLCSYAILSNHYHLVIRLAPDQARSWSDEEVMVRWEKLFGIATPIGIGLADSASLEQRAVAVEMIDVRRQRLTDLSWFPLKTSLVP